jgi:SAM-dependent methyltransferase
MSRDPDWPVAFFDDEYLEIYLPQLTENRTALEVDFIHDALGLAAGAPVLDLACGIGRHAVGMAAHGYQVTGVDFNPRYLEIAAQGADRAGVRVRWMMGDMRTLQFDREFEGVYSYFTSFGYYNDVENDRILGRIAASLRPGGRFLIDMANRDRVLTHPQQRTWTPREDGGLLMEEVSLDLVTSRVTSRQILIQPQSGSRVVKEFDLRVYTCAELSALLDRHGLKVREAWGGPDRSVYSTESRRLILLAERSGAEGA